MSDVLNWLLDSSNWFGQRGVLIRIFEQLRVTSIAVLIACAIALPLGLITGHFRKYERFVNSIGSFGRALPTFALLLLFATSPIGVGETAAILALIIFAIPPILISANVAIASIDPSIRLAAAAVGMKNAQILFQVEVPLGIKLIFAGLRTSFVQTGATATLAAFVGGGGLGRFILDGFARQDQVMVIAGVILVATMTMFLEFFLTVLEAVLGRNYSDSENRGIMESIMQNFVPRVR